MIKTDEEKAINYAELNITLGVSMYNPQAIVIAKQAYLAGLEAGREEAKKQWHDCFLSCSSPYCAEHFPAVKFEGELGNMTKCEVENAESN